MAVRAPVLTVRKLALLAWLLELVAAVLVVAFEDSSVAFVLLSAPLFLGLAAALPRVGLIVMAVIGVTAFVGHVVSQPMPAWRWVVLALHAAVVTLVVLAVIHRRLVHWDQDWWREDHPANR
jgi:hypothetical protein